MRVVFLSNYLNHHQKPLSDALAARCDYTFLATAEMPEERKKLGWAAGPEPEYLCRAYREPDRARACLQRADVVIAGSAPEAWIRSCILRGRTVFRYSERPVKDGPEPLKYLPRLLRWHWRNPAGKPIYLLCAGAYVAADYSRFGLFRERMLQWGYFPETRVYPSMELLWEKKKRGTILWAGRFLDWKHPDHALRAAEALRKSGLDYHMTLVGTGPLEEMLRETVRRKGLADRVDISGPMAPEEVRRAMESAEIFLFTGGRQEGWGAVLNEAMNSGCAVVASDAAGATLSLVRPGENGFVYHDGNIEELTEKTKMLLENKRLSRNLGTQAYKTITEEWNAELAAERFLKTARHILEGKKGLCYQEGLCARAVNHES